MRQQWRLSWARCHTAMLSCSQQRGLRDKSKNHLQKQKTSITWRHSFRISDGRNAHLNTCSWFQPPSKATRQQNKCHVWHLCREPRGDVAARRTPFLSLQGLWETVGGHVCRTSWRWQASTMPAPVLLPSSRER